MTEEFHHLNDSYAQKLQTGNKLKTEEESEKGAWCVRGVCMFAWCCDSEIYSDGVSIYLHVCVCVCGCVCGENLCISEKQLDRERPRVKRVKETMRVRIGTKRMCVCRHKCVCSSE